MFLNSSIYWQSLARLSWKSLFLISDSPHKLIFYLFQPELPIDSPFVAVIVGIQTPDWSHKESYPTFFSSQCLTSTSASASEEIPLLYAYCSQDQKHYANDAEELERYGHFKKSKALVAKPTALNPELVFGITSMSDRHPEESGNVARWAYHCSSKEPKYTWNPTSEMSQTWNAVVSGWTWSRGIWCQEILWSMTVTSNNTTVRERIRIDRVDQWDRVSAFAPWHSWT